MAVLHDFTCLTCDRIFEAMVEASTLPAGPLCPTCAAPTERIFLPPRVTWRADAVVVYRAPDGSFRFPGDTHGPGAAKYDHLGYTRLEARSALEVRALERQLNQTEQSHMARQTEVRAARREHGEGIRRSELRRQMQGMTRMGRDIARAAMAKGDRRPLMRTGESGIRVEAYSNDRSNRE